MKPYTVQISQHLETYENASDVPFTPPDTEITYFDGEHQLINVVSWIRYPSYDFIFGVPVSGKRYEHEIGMFCLRKKNDKGNVTTRTIYVDIEECQEIISGLSDVLKLSKKHSPHLWKKYNEKQRS